MCPTGGPEWRWQTGDCGGDAQCQIAGERYDPVSSALSITEAMRYHARVHSSGRESPPRTQVCDATMMHCQE